MNKIKYYNAFSKVHPSDKTLERIFDMTNKKNNVALKTFTIVIALIAVLCSFSIAVNAATDGAIKDAVSEAVENVSKKITILVNEQETEADVTISEITDEKGNSMGTYIITSSTSSDEFTVESTDKRMMEYIEDYMEISIKNE